MKEKIYFLKDEDELIFTGKQIREFKSKIIEDTKKIIYEKIRETNRLIKQGEKAMKLRENEKIRSPRRTHLGRTQNHLRHIIKQYYDILDRFEEILGEEYDT